MLVTHAHLPHDAVFAFVDGGLVVTDDATVATFGIAVVLAIVHVVARSARGSVVARTATDDDACITHATPSSSGALAFLAGNAKRATNALGVGGPLVLLRERFYAHDYALVKDALPLHSGADEAVDKITDLARFLRHVVVVARQVRPLDERTFTPVAGEKVGVRCMTVATHR